MSERDAGGEAEAGRATAPGAGPGLWVANQTAPSPEATAGPLSSGLVWHLARFGRALRPRGVAVTLSDEADGLAALTFVDVGDRDEVRRALRVALKIRPRDAAAFEELFAEMWRGADDAVGAASDGRLDDPPAEERRQAAAPPSQNPPVIDPTRPPQAGRADARPGPAPARQAAARATDQRRQEADDAAAPALADGEQPGYSPEAILRRKPFEECTAAERAAMEPLIARLAQRLATRRSRRRVPVRGRGDPDLRRSLRRAAALDGDLAVLARRARPIEEARLVVLCDTSGSMDPHSRFLLAFVLALRRAARHSEVFAFNTSLVRLTGWLRSGGMRPEGLDGPHGIAAMLDRLARQIPDWSEGTRIADCLAEFADTYLHLVDSRTVVLILSDGLDRGDVDRLPGALAAIRARARRIVWLNPLAGDQRYQPTARAMAAALPYLDHLLPAHNLESLARLLPLLAA